MSPNELAQSHLRLQRKLAACNQGWRSGRVDRLEEALRAVERELRKTAHGAAATSPRALRAC